MTARFTPGPWAIDGEDKCLITADADGLVIAQTDYQYRTREEQGGNARLIAAAPALYEALESAVAFIEMCVVETGVGERGYTPHILEPMRAALHLARGEQVQP